MGELIAAVEGVARLLVKSLERIQPSKASVEFGVEIGLETGHLTALICKGSGKANLKIALEWAGDKKQQLANNAAAEQGRTLVKRMRAELFETTRPVLEAIVEEATGSKVVSLHHDISTVTGEGVVVFTLAEAPALQGLDNPPQPAGAKQ
jgi:hypothetical protein